MQLRLGIPLGDPENLKVAGTVQFLGNQLRLDSTMPVLEDVRGSLEFTEKAFALRGISAGFLGGQLRIEGETPEPGRFSLRGEGQISAQGIRAVADNALTRAFDGTTGYRVRIDLRRRASEVLIESDLVGLSSTLPAPLKKAAQASWPLKVRTTPEYPQDPEARPRRDQVRVELRQDLRLVLERDRDPKTQRLEIRRGALALNAEPVIQGPGLAVMLDTDDVDVDAWTAVLSRKEAAATTAAAARIATAPTTATAATAATAAAAGQAPAKPGAAPPAAPKPGARQPEPPVPSASSAPSVSEPAPDFSLSPAFVSVMAKTVRIQDKLLHDVVFGASRIGGFWSANVSAREIDGFMNWRVPSQGQRLGTLTARLGRLEIPRSRAPEVETLFEAAPSELPGLDITAQDFVLFGRKLGRLELKATNSADSARPGWSLDTLHIVNRAADFKARGLWAPGAIAGVRPTRLDFELGLIDGGELLAIHGLPGVLRGASGSISGNLHWIGSPLDVDYPSLGGDISLKVGKGQFLKTDPGIGKLVSVLSLQSLPRRLTLDFRDIFSEGFAFDAIVGEVAISHGLARTDNLVMRGVQALVRIRGEADVEKETQALAVEVRPELNAGIASLAYGAMVNPVIGLGSFVAQLALRGPIQEIFSYEYDVTGSWADPHVVEKRRPVAPMPHSTP